MTLVKCFLNINIKLNNLYVYYTIKYTFLIHYKETFLALRLGDPYDP